MRTMAIEVAKEAAAELETTMFSGLTVSDDQQQKQQQQRRRRSQRRQLRVFQTTTTALARTNAATKNTLFTHGLTMMMVTLLSLTYLVVQVQAQTDAPSTIDSPSSGDGGTLSPSTTATAEVIGVDDGAQCVSESAAINTDSTVATATQQLLTNTKDEVLADFESFCNILQRKCTVDLSLYSADLQQACANVMIPSPPVEGGDGSTVSGGQFYDQVIRIDCRTNTAVPDAIEIPGSVVLENVPSCIGLSCDPNNLPSALSDTLEDLLAVLTDEINAALGDSIVCQSAVAGADSSAAPPKVTSMISRAMTIVIMTLMAVVMRMFD